MEDDEDKRLRRIGDELHVNKLAIAGTFQRARKAAEIASGNGKSNRRIAELLGVDRMTVRKWVGKR